MGTSVPARDPRAALERLLDAGATSETEALRGTLLEALPALRGLIERERAAAGDGVDVWSAPRIADLAERIPLGLFVTDRAGRCTYANQRWSVLAGLTAAEAAGTGWHAAIHADDRERVVAQWLESASSGAPFHAELRLGGARGPEGADRPLWVHVDGTKLDPSDTGSPIVGSVVDISDRVRAEIVHESSSRVLAELASGADLAHVLDTLARCAEEAMPGLLCSILLLDDEGRLRHAAAPSLPDAYNQAIDGVEPGPAVGSCGTAAYTGERVVVADVTTHPFWAPYQDLARLAGVRACWSEPIRCSAGKLLGTLAMYYRHPGEPTTHELEATRTAAQVAGIAIERKRREDELRHLQERLRQIIDLVPHMIFAKDEAGRFLLVNRAVAEAYGTTVGELVGRAHADVHPEPDVVRWMLAHDQEVLASGEPGALPEVRFVDAAGELRILQTTKIPFVASGAERPAVLGVAVDVTELKRAQDELERANRELESRVAQRTAELSAANRDLEQEMAVRKLAEERVRVREEELARVMRLQTLGELAGGLAHELNQPLAAITNYASGCVRRMRPGAPITEDLVAAIQRITHQAQRAGEIVHRHRGFTARRASTPSVVDLGELAEGIVDFLAGEARRADAEVRLERAAEPVAVRVDAVQIEQVLVNLVRNAFEAMRSAASPRREVLVRVGLPDGDARRVEVAVEDTGPGMPPDVRDRIFQPFFTTTPDAIGMGLTVCESIVQAHGGSLRVESEPGLGARFRFSLPRE